MSSSERRVDTRVRIRVPFRFRPAEETALAEQLGMSENLSQRGIYFETSVPLKIGMLLEVILRMPYELFGRLTSESKCLARVVRVKEGLSAENKSGIGLHIEQYEAAIAQRERWAN